MSWFQLDPQSIAGRVAECPVPSLRESLWRGIIGFTIVSIAGFLPWVIFGKWLHVHVGEIGMYGVCAMAFIVLSGLLMHRLIMGRGSLLRFYGIFTPAFVVYAIAWTLGWMKIGGHPGSIIGLLSGTAGMGWMFATAFDANGQTLKVIAALFVLNSLGYFIGGIMETALVGIPECTVGGLTLAKPTQLMIAKMQWGICYGVGFGAGLGLAFYLCQTRARALLARAS